MRASWALYGLGQVPFSELRSGLVSGCLHLFEGGDGSLAFAVVVLVGVKKVGWTSVCWCAQLTEEWRLYSSKSLESSSKSVYASLTWEVGRCSEVRAETAPMKSDCDLPRSNISLGSRGVMGVVASCTRGRGSEQREGERTASVDVPWGQATVDSAPGHCARTVLGWALSGALSGAPGG